MEDATTNPELSILIVSYNTRALTLRCLESLHANDPDLLQDLIVVDNASGDGSAESIRTRFPRVRLIELEHNAGFAAANNRAAQEARGSRILLLNPDTIVHEGAIRSLMRFSDKHPQAGICGGRTLFPDGSLNPTSCWRRPSPWSMFCRASGLASFLPQNALFDPESYGRWKRDSVRPVDIISGCFLLLSRKLWDKLDGFDPEFFMYGEDTDLCLRARKLGYRPMLCPSAEITHLGGQSEKSRADKVARMILAKNRIIERHWHPSLHGFGRLMGVLWVVRRVIFWKTLGWLGVPRASEAAHTYAEVWRRRADWWPKSRRCRAGDQLKGTR